MQYPRSRILIFAKAPVPGEVKTRLVPRLGEHGAAKLHERLLEDTVSKAVEARLAPVDLWCSPDTGHPVFQAHAAESGVRLKSQSGGDLGERMLNAASDTLKQADSVLLIGCDCPVLSGLHLRQAIGWLESGIPAVVGPAEDGGYVLLGLRTAAAALFHDMEWGGDRVLEATRERMAVLGWAWRELETLWDVDQPADIDRLGLDF
jgi:rSAM/selenodomain-associated transferase 1